MSGKGGGGRGRGGGGGGERENSKLYFTRIVVQSNLSLESQTDRQKDRETKTERVLETLFYKNSSKL